VEAGTAKQSGFDGHAAGMPQSGAAAAAAEGQQQQQQQPGMVQDRCWTVRLKGLYCFCFRS